jgi:hypothetical protein
MPEAFAERPWTHLSFVNDLTNCPKCVTETVPLILQAIGSIAFVLSGTKDLPEARVILERFFRETSNRISYENTLLLQEPGTTDPPARKKLGVASDTMATRPGNSTNP